MGIYISLYTWNSVKIGFHNRAKKLFNVSYLIAMPSSQFVWYLVPWVAKHKYRHLKMGVSRTFKRVAGESGTGAHEYRGREVGFLKGREAGEIGGNYARLHNILQSKNGKRYGRWE